MNINIIYREDRKSYLKRTAIIWKLSQRNYFRLITYFLAVGLIILIAGFFTPYTYYSEVGKPAYYNFHISISIGGAFILLALLYFFELRKSKKQFTDSSIKRLLRSNDSNRLNRNYSINNEFIKYSTFEEEYEVKWSAINSYKFYEGFICLYILENAPSFLIEIEKLGQENQKVFIDFIEQRLESK